MYFYYNLPLPQVLPDTHPIPTHPTLNFKFLLKKQNPNTTTKYPKLEKQNETISPPKTQNTKL